MLVCCVDHLSSLNARLEYIYIYIYIYIYQERRVWIKVCLKGLMSTSIWDFPLFYSSVIVGLSVS